MSADAPIIFYDLPSKGRCACWSLNPWKTRLALNYKNIPYITQWIEYPDIAASHKSWNIPPNKEGMPYTIPAVYFPQQNKAFQDSSVIASKLEKLYPSPQYPSLHLDSPMLPRVVALIPKMRGPIDPVLMPRVPRLILNPVSAEYFRRTREERFGMPLDELEKSEKSGEVAWKGAEERWREAAALLAENDGGPFFEGKEVTYADFVFVSLLVFLKRLGDDVFDRVMAIDKAFPAIYEASEQWLKRDDY